MKLKRVWVSAAVGALIGAMALPLPALAQTYLAAPVSVGLTQLGFETSGLVLTTDQQAQIQNVLNSSDSRVS